MTDKEIFDFLEWLVPKIEEFKTTKTFSFETDANRDKFAVMIRQTHRLPVNMGCQDCVKNYLLLAEIYYHRELPAYQARIKALAPVAEPTEEVKPKRKKKIMNEQPK